MQKRICIIRAILIALAVALIVIPIAIVGITGNGFGALAADILISLSILSVIAAIMIDIKKANKNRFSFKIGVSIGLLIVMLSLWF